MMLRENIQNALKEAMKAKDMETVSAVRLIIAGQKVKDVEARGCGKDMASDQELMAMMQTMIKQRNESARIYREGGRNELAEKEEKEIKVIERFLPKQLSEKEMEEKIAEIIVAVGAGSIKDMGKVMAEIKTKYAGQIDMGKASSLIKAKLS